MRHGIDSLAWFIYRFNTPGTAWLFRNPRNILRVEEAMISMLAGDVFRDNGVRWRLHVLQAAVLHHVHYSLAGLADELDAAAAPGIRCNSLAAPRGRILRSPIFVRRMSDVATSLPLCADAAHRISAVYGRSPHCRETCSARLRFGDRSPRQNDPRIVRVGLKPLIGADLIEIWHASGPVNIGFDGIVRYAADADHMLGAIELDERDYGGIAGAAEAAYAALSRFVANSRHPNLLRIWNYIDGINQGDGDNERATSSSATGGLQVCGHSSQRGMSAFPLPPASGDATATPMVQVYWLAGRAPGVPLENPRARSARIAIRANMAPTPPSFSRAMLASDRLVMISGTASIVGHASRHRGNVRAQLDETFTNLANVLQRAAGAAPGITTRLGPAVAAEDLSARRGAAPGSARLLRERVPPQTQYIVLRGCVPI